MEINKMIIKEILTILIIFSSFLMLYLTFLNIKNKILNLYEGIIWLLIWLISLFISIRPKTIDNFIEIKLGVSFFYISTILAIFSLIIIIFYFYNKIKILEKKIDKIIRSESLKKIFDRIKD
jgi:hypothetical protein